MPLLVKNARVGTFLYVLGWRKHRAASHHGTGQSVTATVSYSGGSGSVGPLLSPSLDASHHLQPVPQTTATPLAIHGQAAWHGQSHRLLPKTVGREGATAKDCLPPGALVWQVCRACRGSAAVGKSTALPLPHTWRDVTATLKCCAPRTVCPTLALQMQSFTPRWTDSAFNCN